MCADPQQADAPPLAKLDQIHGCFQPFGIHLPGPRSVASAVEVAERIRLQGADPFHAELIMTPGIGLYVPQTLMRHGGIARRADSTLQAWRELGREPLALSQVPQWQDCSPTTLLQEHWRSDAKAADSALAAIEAGRVERVVARLLLPTPGWIRVARTGRLALEVHNPLYRPESLRDTPRVVLGAPTATRLIQSACAGFFVTQQLMEGRAFRRPRRKLAIGNGITLGSPSRRPATAACASACRSGRTRSGTAWIDSPRGLTGSPSTSSS